MTFALLAILALTIAGFLLSLDRRDQRAVREREQEREIVQRLIVHIQAPEVAVATHASEQATSAPPAVDAFNDDDYWKAQQEALNRMAELERELP